MEATKTKVLRALRSCEGYLSGQELCEELGVSRTAVWKYIKQLEEEGYEIQAVRNKGYRLVEIPDVLDESEVRSRLNTKWAGHKVCFYQQVDSTNTQAKRLAEEGAPSGTLVFAETQTCGKGRRGRGWESPPSSAIYMSLLVRPKLPPERASMVTLVMGLSVVQALKRVLNLDAYIKWPNDVVLNKKKIVGILTEMSAQIDYIDYLVIGTGINVNIKTFPPELLDKATSLQIELGHPVSRAQLAAETMECFEKNYEIFERDQNLSELMEEYNHVLANYQQQVRVLEPQGEYSGIARGINEMGELLVEKEDGTTALVYSGEVSVRGLYTYV